MVGDIYVLAVLLLGGHFFTPLLVGAVSLVKALSIGGVTIRVCIRHRWVSLLILVSPKLFYCCYLLCLMMNIENLRGVLVLAKMFLPFGCFLCALDF